MSFDRALSYVENFAGVLVWLFLFTIFVAWVIFPVMVFLEMGRIKKILAEMLEVHKAAATRRDHDEWQLKKQLHELQRGPQR